MNESQMTALLAPYLAGESLSERQFGQLLAYLELLVKWNTHMNLTSVRNPEQIVPRHFGESLFAAVTLFQEPSASGTVVDVGSGAGFPGLPIAIARPGVEVTLIEAHGKKATFLKEAIRATGCRNVTVFTGRAEAYPENADVVTFRAVERFGAILPVSAAIVGATGRLAGLLGSSQVEEAKRLIGPAWHIQAPVYFPGSAGRVLWICGRMGSTQKRGQAHDPHGTSLSS
jgi:16S rRNA (guanine527-N7)-methyltransferase